MESFIDQPKKKTLTELGLDPFGQAPLVFSGAEVNKKAQIKVEADVPPNMLQSGNMTAQITMTDGWIQSSNFVTGVSGWRIHSNGTYEFN